MQEETGWPEKKIGIEKEASISVQAVPRVFTGTLTFFHKDRRPLGSDQVLQLD